MNKEPSTPRWGKQLRKKVRERIENNGNKEKKTHRKINNKKPEIQQKERRRKEQKERKRKKKNRVKKRRTIGKLSRTYPIFRVT